jgi:hypothetical protein
VSGLRSENCETAILADCWALVDLGPKVAFWRSDPPPRITEGVVVSDFDWAKDLLAQAEKNTSTDDVWDPRENPEDSELIGVITERELLESTFQPGEMYPVIMVQTVDGRVRKFYASSAVAKRGVLGNNAQPGDRIAIKYMGKEKGKRGFEFHNYQFAVQKQNGGDSDARVTDPKPQPVGPDGITVDDIPY